MSQHDIWVHHARGVQGNLLGLCTEISSVDYS